MTQETSTKAVEALIAKAADTDNGPLAMHFSQAALNAAQAIRTMVDTAHLTK